VVKLDVFIKSPISIISDIKYYIFIFIIVLQNNYLIVKYYCGDRMKRFLINLIKLYKKIPGDFHNYCRHIPRCSDYGIEAIETHGVVKGGMYTLKRILRCNPFGTKGYDPVPYKELKK
jgi:hypothetical protein